MPIQIFRRRAPSAPLVPPDINGTNEDNRNAVARASTAALPSPNSIPALSSNYSMPPSPFPTIPSPASSTQFHLTQDEIDFIARTETSSWYARAEPVRASDGVAEPRMEPRLHRRSNSSDLFSLRPSIDSSAAMAGRRTVSWTGGRSSQRTSVDSQNTVNTSPKRPSFTARAEVPSQSFKSYGNNKRSNGKENGQKTAVLLHLQTSNTFDNTVATSDKYMDSALTNLPEEIISLIIAELRSAHLETDQKRRTCPTCYLRDLCSLTLCNRQLLVPARKILYNTILIAGSDSTNHIKKRFRIRYGTRLKLLRRTLRTKPELGRLVKTLRVPSHMEAGATSSKKDQVLYEDIVASVVMACPNLERLVGFYPHYDYDSSRIAHALSTRTRLTQQLWNIDGQPSFQTPYARSVGGYGIPLSEQAQAFISHHSGWDFLRTLAIHCRPTSAFDASVLQPLLSHLPSLRHLALSCLSPSPDFIMHLPPLASLHVSIISTATTETLIDITRAPLSATLSSLTLSLLPPDVLSVPVIARILSALPSLSRLSLFSPTPLALPPGITIFLHPYMASPSLKFLHWDIPSSPQSAEPNRSDANYILTKAIAGGGFPRLRRLRAPRDYDGVLQRACRPSRGFDTPLAPPSVNGNGNTFRNGPTLPRRRKDSVSSMSSSASGTSGNTVNGYVVSEPTLGLREARQAAQARIDLARLKPRWKIVCEDWSRREKVRVTAKFDAGGFIGTIGSQVTYWLEEDGIEGIQGLIAALPLNEECNGSWNARHEERRGWGSGGHGIEWHTPREMGWRDESLSALF